MIVKLGPPFFVNVIVKLGSLYCAQVMRKGGLCYVPSGDGEMSELKRKLLETEAQMSRILHAMEAVQGKVSTFSGTAIGEV